MIGSEKRVATLDPDGTPPAKRPAPPDPQHQTRPDGCATSVDNPQHQTRGIPKELIILFVRDLDRAQQYFDLRDDLRVRRPYVPCSTPTQATASKVAFENDQMQKFELLDKPDVLAAVHDYFLELQAKEQLQFCPYPQVKIDKYPLKEPVGYLLFLARQEGYVLDKSPVAEFEKLQKFAPLQYKDHFIRLQAHVAVEEARTVTVSNFADHVSEREIIMEKFFSTFGVIKNIEMQSESHGPVANVTFKDSSAANQALIYRGRKIPGLSKPTVVDGETKYEPLLVKPKPVKDARSDTEKAEDVERMYAEALERYSAIVARYPGDESKRGEDCEDIKYWEHCGWMIVEAMANGGYTVRGQRLP